MAGSPFESLVGLGVSAATGNPIGAAASIIGLGASIIGTAGAAATAKEEAAVSADNARLEGQVNDQRKQAMILTSRRQQMENFRNTQKARAQGLQASVNQGANLGSGAAGGQAQATAQGTTNNVALEQNLGIGMNIFGLDANISENKIKLAQLGGLQATYQGVNSLGGSLSKAAGPLGSMFPNVPSTPNGDWTGNPWSANTGNIY